MNLHEWGTEWLAGRNGTVRETTRVRHDSMFTRHVLCDEIAELELCDLTRSIMVAFMARLANKPNGRGDTLSAKKRMNIYKALDACLADAVAEELMIRNPLDRVRMPRQRESEQSCFTIAEAQSIIDRRDDHKWGWVYALAILTGMRRGEIAGLTWDAIDLAKSCLYVRTTRSTAGSTVIEDDPKTRHGRRRIDLPDIAVEILDDQLHMRDATRDAWGDDWDESGDHWLVVENDGSLPHPDRIGDGFTQYCQLLDLESWGLVACRHTFAALSLAAGTSLEELKVRMGHAQIATTMIYAHWYPGHGAASADALAKVLGY
jgi:integrase